MLKHIPDTYEIIGKIGSGKSGDVYKAYHKNLRTYVVLKKVKTEIRNLVNNRAEVDVLKNLRHSGLPQVYDFLEVDGDVYTVMTFVEGNSFQQYLDSGREFEEKSVIIWARQICATLWYMHEQKPPIVHGDLKPENIMLRPDGNICLIDFNISASLDGSAAWVTGYTNGYAAPEQMEAMRYNQNELDSSHWKKADPRSDLYSFGATLYHLCCGHKPIADEDGYVEDIQETGRKINTVFAAVIMKCLEPNPDKRYQSARELLNDLEHMSHKEKRYKSLILRQKIVTGSVAGLMLVCAATAVMGYLRIGTDTRKEYDNLVSLEKQYLAENDYEKLEVCYQKATDLMPDNLEAYYQKAISSSRRQQYGECIDFINSQILGNEKIAEHQDELNNVYYLLGDCYEKQEDYSNACVSYEKAIEIDSDNGSYYRDYAIALACSGNIDEAKKILSSAKEKGLDSVEADYVQGEILFNTDDYQSAKQIFESCIDKTEDSYMKMRSYIMTAKCIDKTDTSIAGIQEKIHLLEEAEQQLPRDNNIGVLEELAQTYCDAGANGDKEYYQKAIDVFKKIKEQGMGDYDTEYNLAVLYQNTGDYSNAAETLENILDVYGEDYRTYKSLAYLEVSKQNALAVELRNYSKFGEYYEKAEELYQKESSSNANDADMERLQELYSQAKTNGWLK